MLLARDVKIIDLDCVGMANIQDMLSGLKKRNAVRTLFVLHDKGKVIRAVDSHTGQPWRTPEFLDDAAGYASELISANQEFQRAVLIELSAIKRFGQKVNSLDPEIGLVDFMVERYRMFHYGAAPGIVVHPPPDGQWNGFDYEYVKDVIAGLPEMCSVVFVAFDSGKYWGSLIAGLENRQIKLITTLEHLAPIGLDWPPSPEDTGKIITLIEENISPIGLGLITDSKVFRRLIRERLKYPALLAARESSTILWEKNIDRLFPY